MKKSNLNSGEFGRKVLSREMQKTINAGELTGGPGGLNMDKGTGSTCGDEPEDKQSVEYNLWLDCINSNRPTGAITLCSLYDNNGGSFR